MPWRGARRSHPRCVTGESPARASARWRRPLRTGTRLPGGSGATQPAGRDEPPEHQAQQHASRQSGAEKAYGTTIWAMHGAHVEKLAHPRVARPRVESGARIAPRALAFRCGPCDRRWLLAEFVERAMRGNQVDSAVFRCFPQRRGIRRIVGRRAAMASEHHSTAPEDAFRFTRSWSTAPARSSTTFWRRPWRPHHRAQSGARHEPCPRRFAGCAAASHGCADRSADGLRLRQHPLAVGAAAAIHFRGRDCGRTVVRGALAAAARQKRVTGTSPTSSSAPSSSIWPIRSLRRPGWPSVTR